MTHVQPMRQSAGQPRLPAALPILPVVRSTGYPAAREDANPNLGQQPAQARNAARVDGVWAFGGGFTRLGERRRAATCLDWLGRGYRPVLVVRAKEDGVPFAIEAHHVAIPEFCPLLGIPLQRATGFRAAGSPSLDRIRPELGYVPGNVWVISYRANQIKNDATLDELRSIVAGLEAICVS